MLKYGIENVRGRSYSQVNLHYQQIKYLKTEFNTASDSYFNCGQPGHFSKKCNNIHDFMSLAIHLHIHMNMIKK